MGKDLWCLWRQAATWAGIHYHHDLGIMYQQYLRTVLPISLWISSCSLSITWTVHSPKPFFSISLIIIFIFLLAFFVLWNGFSLLEQYMADMVARGCFLCGLSPSEHEVEIRWPRQKELPVSQGISVWTRGVSFWLGDCLSWLGPPCLYM